MRAGGQIGYKMCVFIIIISGGHSNVGSLLSNKILTKYPIDIKKLGM